MNDHVRQTIERCAQSSKDGSAHFPRIVAALVDVGVESYFADYRAAVTTYYLPGGATHAVALPPPTCPSPGRSTSRACRPPSAARSPGR